MVVGGILIIIIVSVVSGRRAFARGPSRFDLIEFFFFLVFQSYYIRLSVLYTFTYAEYDFRFSGLWRKRGGGEGQNIQMYDYYTPHTHTSFSFWNIFYFFFLETVYAFTDGYIMLYVFSGMRTLTRAPVCSAAAETWEVQRRRWW